MLFLVLAVALAVVVLVTMAPARPREIALTPPVRYRRTGLGAGPGAQTGPGRQPGPGGDTAIRRLGPIPTLAAWVVLSSLGWYVLFLAVTAR